MSNGPLPVFDNPPVLEVVTGVQFDRLRSMQTSHFGKFWETVREEFPTSQDAPPLPDVSEPFTVELLTLPPLRRMMLISADNHYVIQVQDSRFHVNWRKTKSSDVYPRFDVIFSKFKEFWTEFTEFVSAAGIAPLKITAYELTYVNHIDANAQEFGTSVAQRVKMYNWGGVQPEFLPQPSSVSAVWQFTLPDGKGNLNANLSHARREKEDVLVLNMGCQGQASETFTLDSWFETAHEWIVRGFTDLTTDEAHKLWGRKE
ncbi:MAG: TIGR04255 family protein [Candidatus Korobacteraceae bacterium]